MRRESTERRDWGKQKEQRTKVQLRSGPCLGRSAFQRPRTHRLPTKTCLANPISISPIEALSDPAGPLSLHSVVNLLLKLVNPVRPDLT